MAFIAAAMIGGSVLGAAGGYFGGKQSAKATVVAAPFASACAFVRRSFCKQTRVRANMFQ